MTIHVLIADDHSVLRAGLRALLEGEPDIEVVGEAEDGIEVVKKALAFRPDVILLDINMPRCDGLEALATLREKIPESRVLVLTMHDDVSYLRQVLVLDGSGYLLKNAPGAELLAAIRSVADGGVHLHPAHARLLANGEEALVEEPDATPHDLSPREEEVFRLLAYGHTNREIGDRLGLSVKTIESYKARLMTKLEIEGRPQLVRLALEWGMLTAEEE